MQACILSKCTAADVYNVDETSFHTKGKSQKVVAVRGSRAVWTTEPKDTYHLSIVVAVAADGTLVPPGFILPGQSCKTAVLDGCTVADAVVATSPKAFINGDLFNAWLTAFGEWKMSARAARPAVLVMDNCAAHLSPESLPICAAYGILRVCLPPNGTHLLLPLDVSVFRGLKRNIARLTTKRLQATASCTLARADSIKIACDAFKELTKRQACPTTKDVRVKSDPIVRGFATCGVWPLSLPAMYRRLKLQETNGPTGDLGAAHWIKTKEVARQDVLTVPANPKERKHVASGSDWLSRVELHAAASRPRNR